MKRKKASTKNRILTDKALQLVLNVMKARKQFLEDELFGLPLVLTRSATAVMAAIDESFNTRYSVHKRNLLNLSLDALTECRHYLMLVDEEGYGNTNKFL